MTIAAASFFAAPTGGATGQPLPGQPAPATGFAEAMVGALATETAAPVAAPTEAAGTTPTPCAMVDPSPVAVFGQDGSAHPIPTSPAPAVPVVPVVETPAPPSVKPTMSGEPEIRPEVARPAKNDPLARIAQANDRPAARLDASGPVPVPSFAPPPASSTSAMASEAVPSTQPTDAEPASKSKIDPEPADIDESAILPAPPAPPVAAGAPALSTPFATLRSADLEAGDEPSGADEARSASASGKPPGAEGPREPASAAATPSQTATFAERLPAGGDGVTTPASAAVGGASAQPAAANPPDLRAPDLPASAPPPRHEPIVDARPGHLGREMGVEIARRLSTGGEELTVRLNPVELGRIEVRLSFDERGMLRAAVSAESAGALEMLRRDSADLGRALTDAGVRADAGSFRFDSQSNGREGGQFWQRQQAANGRHRPSGSLGADEPADPHPIYRTLRASGRVNLVA